MSLEELRLNYLQLQAEAARKLSEAVYESQRVCDVVVQGPKPIVLAAAPKPKPALAPVHVQPSTEPAVMLVGKDFPDLLTHLAGLDSVEISTKTARKEPSKRVKPVSAAFGSSTARFKQNNERRHYNSFGG